MRIDAHHHFWQIGRYDYVWMGPDLGILRQDYLPPDLQPLLERNGIDRSILVQTISSLDETRWFLDLARRHPFIAGVVGWVDLTDPGVGDVLDELGALPGLVGIRHQVHDEPDDRWLCRDDVRRGLAELARRSIPYDLLIRPQHLPVSLEVARSLPDLPLIIDHIAKPAIARRGWDDWAAGIAALAKCPRVACKLSGMVTEADWQRWTPEDLRPYIDHVIGRFGTGRVLFGGDWPVCLLAAGYDRVVKALEVNVAGLSEAERGDVFGGSAARWYRLESRV
jgi:L-fuconolactonase